MIAEQFETHIQEVAARIEIAPTHDLFEKCGEVIRQAQASNFALMMSADDNVWSQRKFHNDPIRDWGRVAGPGHDLLVDGGALKSSVTEQGGSGHVERFMQHEYQSGTSIDYAQYHEYGTVKMPQRSFIGVSEEYAMQFVPLIDDWVMEIFESN